MKNNKHRLLQLLIIARRTQVRTGCSGDVFKHDIVEPYQIRLRNSCNLVVKVCFTFIFATTRIQTSDSVGVDVYREGSVRR